MLTISKPIIGEEEKEAVARVLDSGSLAQGAEVERFESAWAAYTGTAFAVAANSGTAGLHMALAALGVQAGDRVITTTFSFVATASAILMQGAVPVFCDIDPVTYNIDPLQVEAAAAAGARAVMVVHLYGQTCDMDPILDIARRHNLAVIEDACQAHGAAYHGRPAGSLGHAGVFSFYPTKNMTTGEGGIMTTSDPDVAARARVFRNHGQAVRYHHGSLGYNYRMTDMAAAIGLVQLKRLPDFNGRRAANAAYFQQNLTDRAVKPFVMDGASHVFHQYTIRVRDRERFTGYLGEKGIGYGVHYPVPLHRQPLLAAYNGLRLPVAEQAAQEVVSIPVHPSLSAEDLAYIAGAVNSYEGW